MPEKGMILLSSDTYEIFRITIHKQMLKGALKNESVS